MHIQLNGDTFALDTAASVADLITELSLQGTRCAVEVNDELVPRSEHPQHLLNPNDKVEIVQAIGGG